MRPLEGRVALVTGSSRGIGRAIATLLARKGAATAIAYHENRAAAEELVDELVAEGERAASFRLRVESRQSVRTLREAIQGSLGRVAILVNNAAVAQEKPFESISDKDWDRMMSINLRGPFACCQEFIPQMQEMRWGRIVNIASIGGQWGGLNQVHYAAAKAGLISLSRSLARLFSRYGITTNAVAPGLVATDMSLDELHTDAGKDKVSTIPAGRIASSEEIAEAVAFLASEEAGYITGQTINVNGGMYFG